LAWDSVIGKLGGFFVFNRVLTVFAVALLGTACSTTSEPAEETARSGFLPTLSMPSMPTVNIAAISIPGTGQRDAPEVDPDLEAVIYWRVIEDDILVVHASSNGCTTRSDFTVNVEQYHEDVFTVRLSRDDEDRCSQEVPWGIQLGFGFEELGVPNNGRVIVLNPLDERPWDWDQTSPQAVAHASASR
jgi:hypothetical protein